MSQESQMHLHKKNKKFRQAYVEFQITQHEFHSQREETNHSLEGYTTTSALKTSRDTIIYSSIEFHINNPIRQLLHQFKQMLKKKGFKCIQIFQNQLYLVRLTTIDKIKKLFCCTQPSKYLLSIRTHQYRSVRIVSIKPLTNVQQNFQLGYQIQKLLQYLQSSPRLNKPLTNQQMNELDSQYKQDIYSLDATSNYMFSKMLVDINYSIGKRFLMVINQFKQKKCFQQSKFMELVWLNHAINQITDQMLQGFNCSRKQLYEILGYCRKSLENYFYSCIEQSRAENSWSNQKEKFNIPEKDMPLDDSKEEQKGESAFIAIYPASLKHLKLLTLSSISIEIFEHLFLLSQFIKIETQNNQVNQQQRMQFLEWIKQEYGQKILLKLKCIRAAGFMDKQYERFLKQLKFDD